MHTKYHLNVLRVLLKDLKKNMPNFWRVVYIKHLLADIGKICIDLYALNFWYDIEFYITFI